MGEADALSRPVLRAGAAKQVEDALMVLRIDAAAIVRYLEHRKAELGTAAHENLAGHAGSQIFDRVVDQVGEDLLDRKPVADDLRQGRDVNLGFGFGGLMCQRRYQS